MSLFSKLFNKEEVISELSIKSFTKGKFANLSEVPDPVFAQKMMGDGFAILPEEGKIVSPASGEIVNVFPTKHAIGIKTNEGLELLIHIGLDTVHMQGEGFEAHIQTGDVVEAGQTLVTFDLEMVKEKAKSTITPCILTNMDVVSELVFKKENEEVDYNEEILLVKLK